MTNPGFDAQIFILLLLAWAWPGLGHCFGGQLRRGLILMGCVSSLWLTGLLIGGITAIDRYDMTESSNGAKRRSILYFTQVSIAPVVILDRYHQYKKDQFDSALPAPGTPGGYEPSLARSREQGMLFLSLAGLLNALLILDLIFPLREPPLSREDQPLAPGSSPDQLRETA